MIWHNNKNKQKDTKFDEKSGKIQQNLETSLDTSATPPEFKQATLNAYVVVNFLFQLIFIFPLFWGMVMYANEFKTKEKQKLTEIKN